MSARVPTESRRYAFLENEEDTTPAYPDHQTIYTGPQLSGSFINGCGAILQKGGGSGQDKHSRRHRTMRARCRRYPFTVTNTTKSDGYIGTRDHPMIAVDDRHITPGEYGSRVCRKGPRNREAGSSTKPVWQSGIMPSPAKRMFGGSTPSAGVRWRRSVLGPLQYVIENRRAARDP